MTDNILLEASWKKLLLSEFSKPYMLALKNFLTKERQLNKTIYPKNVDIFNAFSLTPIDKVKVVIVGQDPYHGPNQAHGLCFSVLPTVNPPPSLLNIFTELKQDLNIQKPKNGCLINWANQGVLLLNSILTVQQGVPGSHQNQGWEKFTDQVINILNDYCSNIIFLLWGAYAQKKCQNIDLNRHFVLTAPHPSPFSAHKGFLGCKHFSKTNQILTDLGKEVIDWSVV
jgi:uracil-DNA glycosylase